jgi:signal transduction histidine kinase
MDLGRPTVRLFVLAVSAALPPLVLAAIALVGPSWLFQFGAGTALLVFALITAACAAVVTVVGSRGLAEDASAMLDLARHGRSSSLIGGSEGDGFIGSSGGAYERLAVMLEERNRQIGELAESLRAAPIQGDVRGVAIATVRGAISVTRDPTWTLAVLRSPRPAALAAGIYGSDQGAAALGQSDPAPLTDVAQWAATMDPDMPDIESVRYAAGPWGAFVVAEVAAGDELRAILTAPWEGREAPSRAERELLSLLGQNAAIAIEHALLIEQLRSQTDELHRMASVQSDFLRGVTHDLQTPLTSIGAAAFELTREPNLTDAARADLETIAHQADRLRRMVAQLLVASRLEVGAFQPLQEVFRVEPIVRRTWEALRAARPFQFELLGAPHLMVGDPDRLEQVLWALLDNAVKYSPQGSPVSVRISSDGADAGLHARIEIRDEGSGMDHDTSQHAFEQFYRADSARRQAPDGSGVGLYAAKGLVRAMGGDIELHTRLGEGTSAVVIMPAEAAREESAWPATSA